MSRGRGERAKKERGIDLGLAPCSKGEYTAAGYWLLQSPSIITFFSHHFSPSSTLCQPHAQHITLQYTTITGCIHKLCFLKFCILLYPCLLSLFLYKRNLYWCKNIDVSLRRLISDSSNKMITSENVSRFLQATTSTMYHPLPPLSGENLLIACFSHKVMSLGLPVDKASVVFYCCKCYSLLPGESKSNKAHFCAQRG